MSKRAIELLSKGSALRRRVLLSEVLRTPRGREPWTPPLLPPRPPAPPDEEGT